MEYDTNKYVAPESKRTKALPYEIERVLVTTSLDLLASPGVKA